MRKRLIGFFSSGGILPRMKKPIRIGASVMESSAAARHRIGLGEGQRLEQPAFLRLQA